MSWRCDLYGAEPERVCFSEMLGQFGFSITQFTKFENLSSVPNYTQALSFRGRLGDRNLLLIFICFLGP